MNDYVVRDSGERQRFDTGAVRDTQEGKPRYDLISSLALRRIAMLMMRGAVKYGDRNWEKGMPQDRLLASAMRHLYAWIDGAKDGEDHLAAVCFNVMAIMHFEDSKNLELEAAIDAADEHGIQHCWATDPMSMRLTHCTKCGLWYGHHLTPSGKTTICRPYTADKSAGQIGEDGTPLEPTQCYACQNGVKWHPAKEEMERLCSEGKHCMIKDFVLGERHCAWCGKHSSADCYACTQGRRDCGCADMFTVEGAGTPEAVRRSRGGCAPTEVRDET